MVFTQIRETETCVTIFGKTACSLNQTVLQDKVSLSLEFKKIVQVADPFVVTLVADPSGNNSEEKLADFQFLLSAAGADVQPKDWLAFVLHGVPAKWSVVVNGPTNA
jgi:hypothetical protein